jgi:hypothetical protein
MEPKIVLMTLIVAAIQLLAHFGARVQDPPRDLSE